MNPGVSPFDQHAADAVAARLAVHAAEHDEPLGFVGAADQRLDAVHRRTVAFDRRVGPIVRYVGPGVRLGHAHRQHDSPEHTLGRMSRFMLLGRIGRDEPRTPRSELPSRMKQ